MHASSCWIAALALLLSATLHAQTVTIDRSSAEIGLGGKVWVVGKVDGKGVYMDFAVNGVAGGTVADGKLNSQNGEYVAPGAMPANPVITISGKTRTVPVLSASTTVTLKKPSPTLTAVAPLTLACAPFTITLTGSRFAENSVVWIGAKAAPTTFVSSTQLSATGTGSVNGALAIKVVNADGMQSPVYYQARVSGCGSTTPSP
ncbi:MAG TPA: IPT/TIG domain-containing protein, partial [Burkholderiaceae bacterium]